MTQQVTAGGPRLDEVASPTRAPIEVLLRDLRSSADGIGSREVARRLAVYGQNVLPRTRGPGAIRSLVRQVTHPLALLLWCAAVLALAAGTPALCWAILAVIVLNAAVASLQERQAAKAVEALAAFLPQQTRVIRDGIAQLVPAADLVPGDVLLLAEGDQVSADARLIDGAVEMDMSALTGESAPVSRSAGTLDTADRLLDAPDAVFSGTSCTSGLARAVVFATGSHAELGRIAALSQRNHSGESPLERQVRRTAWLIAAVAVAIGLLFLPLGLMAGLSLTDSAIFAVGLLVANVPEGLLPTITLALAVGVRVLARGGALVKRLSAVETLGCTTVICTDKTGTLTENKMRVVHVWVDGTLMDPATRDPALARLAEVMADCNDLQVTSDPMETALRESASRLAVDPAAQLAMFRFDPQRKRMSVTVRRDDELRIEVKGAPERVVPLCTRLFDGRDERPLGSVAADRVADSIEQLARQGLRVLALAYRSTRSVPAAADEAERDLCLLGLVLLLDPPRPDVAPAVKACHDAGIRIHVITGDHGSTAAEIAREVGISASKVVPGPECDAMSEAELDHLLMSHDEIVFARSTPEGKLRIAEGLQQLGEVVAMTGDGVNDAPALHRADIGVAMGRSGTDVARQAASMVLTDDNFATIAGAIREGRRVYENLRKFVLYIFAHAVPEVVPFAVFALSAGRIPLPLTVLQILAIDLGTETLPALALGRERAEPDLMNRPPRSRKERLISGRVLIRAWLLMGTVSAACGLALFFAVLIHAGWHPGDPVGHATALHHAYLQATTATFLSIVACQVGTAFAARTERSSLRTIGVFSNGLLLTGIAGEIAFAVALVYLPPLQDVFGTAALPIWALAPLPAFAALVWGADEVFRWAGRQRRSAAA